MFNRDRDKAIEELYKLYENIQKRLTELETQSNNIPYYVADVVKKSATGEEKKGWCEEMIEAIKDDTEVALSRTDSLRYDYDLLLDHLGLKAEYVHAHRRIVKKAKVSK